MPAGASDEQIAEAESRLGVRFPQSYRSFLKESNGTEVFLPVEEVDWFRVREPGWAEAWLEGYSLGLEDSAAVVADDPTDPALFPVDQLAGTLAISRTFDQRILLLNPAVTFEDGEWEAWDFATWYPGAFRHRSFSELYRTVS